MLRTLKMHLLYTPQTQLLLPSYRAHVLCANTVSQLNSRLWPSCHSDMGGSRHGWGFSRRTTCYLHTDWLTSKGVEDNVLSLFTFKSGSVVNKRPSPLPGLNNFLRGGIFLANLPIHYWNVFVDIWYWWLWITEKINAPVCIRHVFCHLFWLCS